MEQFDDIRPYYNSEIPAAMQRIAQSEAFPLICSYVFPGKDVLQMRQRVARISSIKEFQEQVMVAFNEQVIARSITDFSCVGLEALDATVPYLFVSNHRDIVLDSSLLQYKLHQYGVETTEITFGANLMCTQLIIDIGKSNKMFRVERGGTPKEFYRCSKHLSDYIRNAIVERRSSIWIAQRNGRTKDGRDATDQGIIKMFGLSRIDDKVASLNELHIVPVSVSYEWESCDFLKTFELYFSRNQNYVKRPGEDVNSILTGITEAKGRVHFEVCEPLRMEELASLQDLPLNEFDQQVARLIDQRINNHYHLWPSNYIAHDLLYARPTYRSYYSDEELKAFKNRMAQLDKLASLEQYQYVDLDIIHQIFLGIYANPVANQTRT